MAEPFDIEAEFLGRTLDKRYRIQSVVGTGGFATVFLAEHVHIKRPVAVKVLNVSKMPESVRIDVRARFLREAQLIADIDHPCVVRIHDFGIDRTGAPYIVMQHLDGTDLAVEIETNGPMAPARAARLLRDVLDGIGRAHARQVVHRDLKPANLFLHHDAQGSQRLVALDFGIAAVIDASGTGRRTATGQLIGTPGYLPPEYINEGVVLPRFDVYQMGLIFAEMICGHALVEGNVAEVLWKHSDGSFEVPQRVSDSRFGRVIARAICVDHERRYVDAHAFRDAIEAVGVGEHDAATPPHALGRRTAQRGRPAIAETMESVDGSGAVFATNDPSTDGHEVGDERADIADPVPDGAPTDVPQLKPPARGQAVRTTNWFFDDEGESRSDRIWLAALLLAILFVGGAVFVECGSGTESEEDGTVEDAVAETTAGPGRSDTPAVETGTAAARDPASESARDPSPSPLALTSGDAEQVDSRTAFAPTAADVGVADTAAPPEVELAPVRVTSEPPRAAVFDIASGERLGRTPLTISVPPTGLDLQVRLRGHQNRAIRIDPERDAVTVRLRPRVPPPRADPSPVETRPSSVPSIAP